MKLLPFTVILFLSPLWPLGENPTYEAPFVIVNKANLQLAFINEGEVKTIYPVATGITKDKTPEGMFTIVVKAKQPYYRKSNIPGGDPKNPLGARWIGFDAKDTNGRVYGVHGTNQPETIGKRVSAGCIRMDNKDVIALFDDIPIGTKIWIVDTAENFEALAKSKGAIKERHQSPIDWWMFMN
ncbi:Putative L,D-transpeptidase YkuD [Paraliobacillus sp. PM-2]|uniref:L,D-transpeptidase n=1 Tax=Paraliobacillus sp. PM-2 TaxID=1462524 RepID=UPI00061CB601|nr:L,D-transpeptidase [Paraliobacillus sp. PM-2]CQR46761.1 Putative L,D-transpeptidase YkuD [Paraliobacillus sp. PM-2]